MNTKTFDCGFDIKSISDSGVFAGYGSVFGNEDSQGDVVMPGAFEESIAKQKSINRFPAMLWQHKSAEPLGVYTSMHEDAHGLFVEGKLALDTVRGAEAYSLMKIGALTGLSIGYKTIKETFDKVKGVNLLEKLHLWEVSLVTFPSNDSARVQGVKSIEEIEDLKSAEQFLRESGMSRREATAFISRIKNLGQRDADDGNLQQILAAIQKSKFAN